MLVRRGPAVTIEGIDQATGLGDFRSDVISVLAFAIGDKKATKTFDDGVALLKGKAKEGAESAIPTIEKRVEAKVKKIVIPLVGVSIALSALAIILALRK